MSDQALVDLAAAAGIAPRWRDAFDQMQAVTPATLRLVLEALGVPAQTDQAVSDSLTRLRSPAAVPTLPPLVTADMGQPIFLAAAAKRFCITLEDGGVVEGVAREEGGRAVLPPIMLPGYHELLIGEQRTTLAVAPARGLTIEDISPAQPLWGLATQLYALRRAGDGGIGDFAALRAFVRGAAGRGADAVAISPIHAQFSADLDRFSPYGPSSRVALNVLHADVDELLGLELDSSYEALGLVDWPGASRARLARFRAAFAVFMAAPGGALRAQFTAFRAQQGDVLELHARFEALHGHLFGSDPGLWNWHSWPEPFRHPSNPAVAAFAREHESEVMFHAFLQFLADRGIASAQAAAREAGMKIGLIADLAVGTDGGGSHAWSRQGETLLGLSVGAPPDILNTSGQDWGLAAFSPTGLIRHGFSAYIEMLRGALRHAGGVRIDHVMGLARLWVLPQGALASEGAYLQFPLHDLLRLIALESARARAIVLGEDLGTVPEGFAEQLGERGLMGLRVLWFEYKHGGFTSPAGWTRTAAAMTSTHDLATVAGWWGGHDLNLRRGLGLLGDDTGIWYAYENRSWDRPKLWNALCASGAAGGAMPDDSDTAPVVDAAIRHIGGARCELALVPTEDVQGAIDQPNLPGTTDQHPNWRRRMAFDAESFFADTAVSARLACLDEARKHAGT